MEKKWLSVEVFKLPLAEKVLQHPGLEEDIKHALSLYLTQPSQGTLLYLEGEENFQDALCATLREDFSTENLDMILDHIIIKQPDRKVLDLKNMIFGNTEAFLSYYVENKGVGLSRTALSDILKKRPDKLDQQQEKIYCLWMHLYIDIKKRSLICRATIVDAIIEENDKISKICSQENIKYFEWKHPMNLLYTLQYLFPNQDLFDIFELDPIEVLHSRKHW